LCDVGTGAERRVDSIFRAARHRASPRCVPQRAALRARPAAQRNNAIGMCISATRGVLARGDIFGAPRRGGDAYDLRARKQAHYVPSCIS
jgi:hypothetical protein